MFEALRARAGAWLRSRLPEPWTPPPRTLAVDPADPDRIGFGPGVRRQPLSPPSVAEAPWARDVGWGGCVAFLDPAGLRLRRAPAAGETVPVRLCFPFQGRVGAPFWALFARAGLRDETGGELDGPGDLRGVAPGVGETLRVVLDYPFLGRLGAPFWALYEHPHGYRNGYLDGPEEAKHLAAVRFVRCRLVPWAALPAPGSYETLELEAEILEVLGPDDLLALPPSDGGVEETIRAVSYRPETNADGRLTIVSSNIEGDVLNWLLLAKVGASVHLIAHGEEVFHEAAVMFGNRPLTGAEAARLGIAPSGDRDA